MFQGPSESEVARGFLNRRSPVRIRPGSLQALKATKQAVTWSAAADAALTRIARRAAAGKISKREALRLAAAAVS